MTVDKRPERPVDQGWAWVICFACFMTLFCVGMAFQTLSVLFLEIVEEFETTVTTTSLIMMCYVMFISVSSLISTSLLVPRFKERRVVIISGFVFAACSVLYSVVPNIALMIAVGALQGSAVGMVMVPCLGLLSNYFNKRRAIATTICNSGMCIAGIIGPLIIRNLTNEFGMRGTFLIVAGIELHMSMAGLLMRPLILYKPLPPAKPDKTTDESEVALMKDIATIKEENGEDDKNGDVVNSSPPASPTGPAPPKRLFSRMDSQISYIYASVTEAPEFPNRERINSITSEGVKSTSARSYQRKCSLHSQHSTTSWHSSTWSVTQGRPRPLSHHDSTICIPGAPADITEEAEPAQKPCCLIWFLKLVFDPQLLRQWTFRAFLLGSIPAASGQYLLQYMATIVVVQGATKGQAATLLTIINSVDLASRLVMGLMVDTKILRPSQMVAIAQICLGIVCQFNPLFRSFETLIVMVVLIGIFVGSRQSLMAMIHVEIVGLELMSRCLSITAVIITLSSAAHSPMLGAIVQATGSFIIPLYYIGMACIVGGVVLLMVPLLERLDKRLELKKQAASNGQS